MISVEVLRPSELTLQDRNAWAAIVAAEPRFANPLLSFEFARRSARFDPTLTSPSTVARVGPIGFLAHHRTGSGLARPIGSPFSDYHALISEPEPGLSGTDVLATARLRGFRYTGLIDPWRVFAGTGDGVGYRIEVEGGSADVLGRPARAQPAACQNLAQSRRGDWRETASWRSPRSTRPAPTWRPCSR
jgi:CelD/BcsL family acetyltransferase involved in cellulose biosynthesis